VPGRAVGGGDHQGAASRPGQRSRERVIRRSQSNFGAIIGPLSEGEMAPVSAPASIFIRRSGDRGRGASRYGATNRPITAARPFSGDQPALQRLLSHIDDGGAVRSERHRWAKRPTHLPREHHQHRGDEQLEPSAHERPGERRGRTARIALPDSRAATFTATESQYPIGSSVARRTWRDSSFQPNDRQRRDKGGQSTGGVANSSGGAGGRFRRRVSTAIRVPSHKRSMRAARSRAGAA
jgi:hypothetical protein